MTKMGLAMSLVGEQHEQVRHPGLAAAPLGHVMPACSHFHYCVLDVPASTEGLQDCARERCTVCCIQATSASSHANLATCSFDQDCVHLAISVPDFILLFQ